MCKYFLKGMYRIFVHNINTLKNSIFTHGFLTIGSMSAALVAMGRVKIGNNPLLQLIPHLYLK